MLKTYLEIFDEFILIAASSEKEQEKRDNSKWALETAKLFAYNNADLLFWYFSDLWDLSRALQTHQHQENPN